MQLCKQSPSWQTPKLVHASRSSQPLWPQTPPLLTSSHVHGFVPLQSGFGVVSVAQPTHAAPVLPQNPLIVPG